MTAVLSRAIDASALRERLDRVTPVLAAHARTVDAEASFPTESVDALRASGLMGLMVPARWGGMDGTLRDLVRVGEHLAGSCLSTAMIWAMHCQQVAALAAFGGDRLRDEVLPRIAAGSIYLASVTSERGKGGHLLTADAPLELGADEVGLHRDAPIVTGGLQADAFLVTMRHGPDAPRHAVSLVYADRAQLAVSASGDWDPMGMRGTHSVALRLDGRVPADQIVGPPGGFREVAIGSFVPAGHLGWAACWVGAARAALAEVVTLLRSTAGRRQIPASAELVRARLARVRLDLDVTATFVRAVADAAMAQAPDEFESVPFQLRLNAVKIQAAERAFAVVDELIQLVGLRHGYLRNGSLQLERLFRDLRSASLNYANDRLLLANGALTLLDREVRLD